jgi:hypothetical protein
MSTHKEMVELFNHWRSLSSIARVGRRGSLDTLREMCLIADAWVTVAEVTNFC